MTDITYYVLFADLSPQKKGYIRVMILNILTVILLMLLNDLLGKNIIYVALMAKAAEVL